MEVQTQTEPIAKRSYTKVDLNGANQLTAMLAGMKISISDVAKHLDCSHATAKKHLLNPLLFNGIERKQIASLIQLDIAEVSQMIDAMK
jgi:hypothetical protein